VPPPGFATSAAPARMFLSSGLTHCWRRSLDLLGAGVMAAFSKRSDVHALPSLAHQAFAIDTIAMSEVVSQRDCWTDFARLMT
jgi:hypothetical protein